MAKSYIALIADAIASRDLPPTARARLQADARDAVKDLNRRYRRVLAARFAITLGDELQCLLATLEPLASYYSALYWSWTPRQRRTATLLRLGDPAAAAARLDVDRSAISHLARRMAWPLVAAGDKMFRALLEREPA